MANSGQKLQWRCEHGHIWLSTVDERTPPKCNGCPYCSGKRVLKGFKVLLNSHPELAAQAEGWNPSTVTVGSSRQCLWRCSKGHIWKAAVASRTPPRSTGCPYCAGQKVLPGCNDVLTLFPGVAREAYDWVPASVAAGTDKKISWQCKRYGHIWQASVYHRCYGKTCCPFCGNKPLLLGFNNLATLFPEIAEEAESWDPGKEITGWFRRLRWHCANNHIWTASIANRVHKGSGCPTCSATGFNPGDPAWLYLLSRPGEQQLGITNRKEKCLHHHAKFGWFEVDATGPLPGDEVLALEKKLKKWLRREVGLVPKTHKNWFTARIEVQSLAELKSRSGVETDLF
jgi:hypothetical protein